MSGQTLDPEFASQIHEALRQVSSCEVGPITADSRIADLGLDSLALNELAIVLQDALHLTLGEEEFLQLRTFGDLQDLVGRLRSAPPV
jgi:acyl carrier protein